MDAYRKGLTGNAAAWAAKRTSDSIGIGMCSPRGGLKQVIVVVENVKKFGGPKNVVGKTSEVVFSTFSAILSMIMIKVSP